MTHNDILSIIKLLSYGAAILLARYVWRKYNGL